MNILLDASVWASAIRGATPILLAALGCLLCAKAGITNLAIDGFITVGCFISIAVVNITGGKRMAWNAGRNDRHRSLQPDIWLVSY